MRGWIVSAAAVLGVFGAIAPASAAEPAPRVRGLSLGIVEVISSQPGAPVHVDGDLRGRTPVRVAGLEPGIHRVEVGRAGDVVVREVLVEQGRTVRVEVGSGGDAPPVAPAERANPLKAFLVENPSVVSMLQQPWAWMSALLCGSSLVTAGILWTSTPERFPVVGTLPMTVTPMQWLVARWASVALVGALALTTVVLFLLPALPWVRDLATPAAPATNKPAA